VFQHQNRALAHADLKSLSPACKAVFLYITGQIRKSTHTFSISQRRLSEALGMSKTTIGRSLETLEEKGYLIRNASPVSIFANVFELNIECPEGCKDFEIHYTQTEKKLRQSGSLLESGSILSKSGSILTTHIENYKEKERFKSLLKPTLKKWQPC